MAKVVSIGCFSGFWGDSIYGASQLVKKSDKLDYLIGDYLAEVTMGILARLKKQPPKGGAGEGGYVAEFAKEIFAPLLKDLVEKNIKVVTNAGGMNPIALKKQLEEIAKKLNFPNIKIAAVQGDDITDKFAELQESGSISQFSIAGETEKLPENKMMLSSNAYFGAFPIAHALQSGAHIVVTGRVVDSALALGPLIYEFGWKSHQYDLLAAGSVAGHIIECGCHATGGNLTDWESSLAQGWEDVGYPIAECYSDGHCLITKPKNTGGLVSVSTVAEQLVYEIGDPKRYILPDVVVDFSQVKLEEVKDPASSLMKVKVSGARGSAPTPYYKVSNTYFDGFKLQGIMMIGGIDAKRKAEATAAAVIARTSSIFKSKGWEDYKEVHIEALGSEQSYGPVLSRTQHSREVLLRFVASHSDKRALGLLAKEVIPSALSMAPGITGGGAGRPKVQPSILYNSCLVSKSTLAPQVIIGNEPPMTYHTPVTDITSPSHITHTPSSQTDTSSTPPITKSIDFTNLTVTVPLIKVCFGRSGDKGDVSNIGIICRKPHLFPYIKEQLTAEVVKGYMGHLIKGKVERYELPGIHGFNFICTKSLGGGGMSSPHMDRQGKCYAQMLLDYPITLPYKSIYQHKL
eukprot:TRINITY_DN2616_c0_g1_i3.p1 TRINITY_DN2616_c0_g1~~TRINITY_DN2616_c0_g1_i3.p1  ORF type:complete len:630 (+),score=111.76 TRINITY_DN2616_c0_g1_i3:758-2647(+)